MAGFVVVAPPPSSGVAHAGIQLSIFPGSATPSVFPAAEAFWIGYGFVSEPGGGLLGETRFELEVDGKPVELVTEVEVDAERKPVSMLSIASFGSGLEPGWHRFSGRWYDRGRLVLTSDRSIQFVES